MPTRLEAGLWGLLGGGALVIGALIAWFTAVPPRVVASVMAFGSGVLISAVAFDLMEEAACSRPRPASSGARSCTWPRTSCSRDGAPGTGSGRGTSSRRRRRCRAAAPPSPSGRCWTASPESVVLGMGLLGGGSVSLSVLAAVFISNVPEGPSSASGMKRSGRSVRYVFGVWGGIAVISGLSALLGYTTMGDASRGPAGGAHVGHGGLVQDVSTPGMDDLVRGHGEGLLLVTEATEGSHPVTSAKIEEVSPQPVIRKV